MNTHIFDDFVNAINRHDIDRLYDLMTANHLFIDAQGNEIAGRDKMKMGWSGYFKWFPDYKIEITDIFIGEERMSAFGFASGTFKGIKTNENQNYWRIPAAWKIAISDQMVSLWQVYADTKIPFDIIEMNK